MKAIDSLADLLRGPTTLKCPTMRLLARDPESVLAEGSGEIEVLADSGFRYHMVGKPPDLGHSLRALHRLRANDYEVRNHFRLEVTDDAGLEWQGGWTVPTIREDGGSWLLSGSIDLLSRDTFGPQTEQPATEVRFLIPQEHPAREYLPMIFAETPTYPSAAPTFVLEVLGTPVAFSFDEEELVLSVSAPTSPSLSPPFAENWLGEPLRILFGQPVYPRLLERQLPGGRSALSVRRVVRWRRHSSWTGLWMENGQLVSASRFKELYCRLLSFVAKAGSFESSTLTEFYEHVSDAADSSKWVLALTLASSIEGLGRMLVPRNSIRPDADPSAIESLVEHISRWRGLDRLKGTAINAVRRADVSSMRAGLLRLAGEGVGTRKQVASWENVRNRVMHGELVSPYSSKRDDRVLSDLAGLLHALTTAVVFDPGTTS